MVDLSLYVMTSEFGSALQLEKTVMLDEADMVVLNKCDNPTAISALKQVGARLRGHAHERPAGRAPIELFGVSAVRHRDGGTDRLFAAIRERRLQRLGSATV
jgi:methylmalonyl-CoA mutase